jgi:hypothetical protein
MSALVTPVTEFSQSLVCPVCQAEQTPSNTCRRCHADLSVVVSARRGMALTSLASILYTAIGRRDAASRSLADLRLLAPGQASAMEPITSIVCPTVERRGKQSWTP